MISSAQVARAVSYRKHHQIAQVSVADAQEVRDHRVSSHAVKKEPFLCCFATAPARRPAAHLRTKVSMASLRIPVSVVSSG
jgi:hypothetical protein